MSSQIQVVRSFLRARLSRRIVLWVFFSILLIELIILLPSIYRRRQELLNNLTQLTIARIEGGLAVTSPADSAANPATLLTQLQQLTANSSVRGGVLYNSSGQLIGRFGEVPALSLQQAQASEQPIYHWQTRRYDQLLAIQPLTDRYNLIVRQDVSGVQQELIAFIGRIALLITIISIFVTLTALIGLERILITPILFLRNDLLKLGQAVQQDQPTAVFDSLPFCGNDERGNDELGEVIAAFHKMYEQVIAAITERKQAEVALRQSEEKFSKSFRASPSAILISTLKTGRLIEVNNSFLQLYGGTLEEVIGKTSMELNLWTAPEYRQGMIQHIQETGAIHNLEYVFHNKAGEPRSILFSAEQIDLNGEACLVAVANDITDRKEAEKALERLAEIGELTAMIVHEVRNPLTTVMMGLRSFQSLELSERSQLRLSLAIEEAERLQKLLNEILQYTRCQKLDATELEINHFIQDLFAVIAAMPVAQGRSIEFQPIQPIYLLGDRDKLKQVFINLLSNACEATSEGDQIGCRIEFCAHHQTVCIHIYNAGQPIPPDILAQLTKPFFTTKSTGNGLGLAIVKRIVEAHKGELKICSSDQLGGTQVSVILPFVSRKTA
ncbi:MAG: ATP-binding protein [Elainella sp. Prado103]|nr:ATP-binding protein [Elainella sp. Prado103]